MTEADASLPRHILLATDLSARCDRAQDRALDLARAWTAKLTVAHALDLVSPPNDEGARPDVAGARTRAFTQIYRELKDAPDVAYDIDIREGHPTDVVLGVARERSCGLIVTGIAGNDPLGRFLLGSTTTAVIQQAEQPVLVVKKRCRAAYGSAVVASDLSEASAGALEMAAKLIGPSRLTLFHAFDMPFRGFAEDKRAYEQGLIGAVLEEAKRFLAGCLGDAAADVGLHVAYGDPATLLSDYVAKRDVDLVVTGTRGRTGILRALLGSVATAILDEVLCDVLIVPSQDARPAA